MEIEYKYLVDPVQFLDYLEDIKSVSYAHNLSVTKIRQGYIYNQDKKIVRIRIENKHAFLTYKEPTANPIIRYEKEQQIGTELAEKILALCPKIIAKTRYTFTHPNSKQWMEVDFFHDTNLVLCEIEVDNYLPNQNLIILPWMIKDVSTDPQYFNCNM
jgi:adenylate cyclase